MSVGFSVCYHGTEIILQVTNCQATPELLNGVLGTLGLYAFPFDSLQSAYSVQESPK